MGFSIISTIAKYATGSLLSGFLIAVSFLVLFFFIIRGWRKDAVFQPISFIVLGILCIIVFVNSTIICGAISIKNEVDDVQAFAESTIQQLRISTDSVVNVAESEEVVADVINKYPVIKNYIGSSEYAGLTASTLPGAICDTFRDYLNNVIWKILVVSIIVIALLTVIIIKTLTFPSKRGGRTPKSLSSPRRTPPTRVSRARR